MDKELILDEAALEKLNRFTRTPVTAEQVYAFPVVLCDNEVDRDGERFSTAALEKLAELFVGKTGIFDHDPKSSKQTARIFDCEAVTDSDRVTSAGEPYTYLYAKAYMMRTDSNRDLIAEIEGGIKKEVSVSCSADASNGTVNVFHSVSMVRLANVTFTVWPSRAALGASAVSSSRWVPTSVLPARTFISSPVSVPL